VLTPLDPLSGEVLSVVQDSRPGQSAADMAGDSVARRAATRRSIDRGVVSRGDERYAEVAVPLAADGTVLLLSASLRAESRSAALVARRILFAAGAALVAVVLLGSFGARVVARRIRRLQLAARRIAGGQFDAPVEDPAADDLGELAHELETMRGQLARLDGARKQFIANASHELRTPLFAIRGFLELLDDEELDRETQREFIRTTREQLERLIRLALDLLDLSWLDAGRMPLSPEPVRLGRVAGSVVRELSAAAKTQRHRLELHARGEIVVLGDRGHITRMSARSSRTRFAIRRPEPPSRSTSPAPPTAGGSVSRTQARASPQPTSTGSSSASTGSKASSRPAAGSASRSRSSWPRLMAARIDVDSSPGHTTFSLVLPLHDSADESQRETHALA
jgi:HAMP domain-containing protein